MYFIVTLGVGVGAVGQPKLGTLGSELGVHWVYSTLQGCVGVNLNGFHSR